MAATKSPQYPYQWPDGTWHSKPKAGFTPTPSAVAPAGTYDTALDASRRAASRGLLYTTQDLEKEGTRAETAYLAGKEQSTTQRGWSLADALTGKDRSTADLTTGHDRGKVDLATALSRSREDTTRATDDLGRNYRDLGAQQTARASSGAFVDTSSIRAAGAKRGENQGRDQSVIDTNQSRYESDNATQGSRLDADFATGIGRIGEDYTTSTGRTNQTYDWQDAGAAAEYGYGVNDRADSLSRALSEDRFYGQDTDAAKLQQATSSGLYTPPVKPGNEFSDSKGPYQLITAHGLRFKLRPDGKREAAGVVSA